MSDRFWDAFESSMIIQGLIALSLLFVISALYLTNRVVPQELISLFSLVLGFYFGTKSKTAIDKGLKAVSLRGEKHV